jgi:hypothetical protein
MKKGNLCKCTISFTYTVGREGFKRSANELKALYFQFSIGAG